MNLTCPSCGVVHDTLDYPKAFEINCVCGYSLLVPIEMPGSQSVSVTTFEKALPSAMDAEDDAVLIRPDGLLAMNPGESEVVGPGGMQQMTPPEQLPSGMVYDSFELPPADEIDLGNVDVFGDAGEGSAPPGITSADFDLPDAADGMVESATNLEVPKSRERPTSAPTSGATPRAPVKERTVSRARAVVQRVQMSSMGQFLGRDYRLQLEKLTPDHVEHLLAVVNRMQRERPWLEAECKKRGLDFKRGLQAGSLEHIPELIALEIYLGTFELGASCKFEVMG